MKKAQVINEIMSELKIDYKNSLDELSQYELEEVLARLVYFKEYTEENFILAKELVYKAYSEEEASFYYEIIEYMYGKKEKNEIVDKYANGEYKNEIFCRTGIEFCWEIESEILIKRGYPRVKDVLSQMFLWFQDINWPGAMEISKLLSLVEKKVVIPHLEEIAMIAKEENDIEWLYFLGNFMENNEYKKEDFKNEDIYELLKKSTDM